MNVCQQCGEEVRSPFIYCEDCDRDIKEQALEAAWDEAIRENFNFDYAKEYYKSLEQEEWEYHDRSTTESLDKWWNNYEGPDTWDYEDPVFGGNDQL